MTQQALRAIGPQLWVAEADLFYGGRMAHFPLRMSVMQLADRGLVLWSPIALDAALVDALAALGPVRHIVAPNSLHHLYAQAAADRFPEAQLWLSPALERKPALLARGRVFERAPADWDGVISARVVGGMPALEEIVACHHPSRTLVVTDLVFNLHETRGVMMPLVLRLSGTWRRLAQSRIVRSGIKDKAATRASYGDLLDWDFDRLLMAHGDILASGGKPALAEALSWIDPQLSAPAGDSRADPA